MRILGGLAAVLLVACQVTVRADDDAGDAGDASTPVDAGTDGCTGTEYADLCRQKWPGYTRGYASQCAVDAAYPCHNFDDDAVCCP